MAAPVSRTRLICPLTSADAGAMRRDMLAAAQRGADTVECRLDYLDPPADREQLQRLLQNPPAEIIATNRPVREGGRFRGDEKQRLNLLHEAARCGPGWVDVEREVLGEDAWDAPVILSHHDFAKCPGDLEAIAASLDRSPAAVNKIAFAAAGPEDALRAFDILRASRKPMIALAMGEAGVMSRILAAKFGAFGTFAALTAGAGSAPGQPTLDELKNLYRWEHIGPATGVYGVIGCPVAHSMSPAIHNAAFAAAGLDAVYVPLLIQPGAENFNRFMDALLARPWMDWRGLSVTIPHKENALAYVGADRCEPLARTIGAVNTITIGPDGGLQGHNTDYAAAVDALTCAMGISREQLSGRRVAILGAGGAARAIVAALRHYHAEVTIYNRTLSRAEGLAAEFGARAEPLGAAKDLDAEIVINCTPIGMHPKMDASPLERIPSCAKVVFDTIYNPIETRLLRLAADAGARTVSGLEMFTNQAVAQFEIWTDRPAPREVMRQVVIDRLRAARV